MTEGEALGIEVVIGHVHIINPAWLMADLQPAPKLNTDPQKSEEQDPR